MRPALVVAVVAVVVGWWGIGACSGGETAAGDSDGAAGAPTAEAAADGAAGRSGDAVGAPLGTERADAYRADPRVSVLLADCPQTEYYDRDTSYMLPVLVEKLERGYTEPLQRSKDELARLGDEAIELVRRLAERWFSDSKGASYVQNALDVAVMSDAPSARDVVLRFLDHPREILRRGAVRGLILHHARPEDFDRLWLQFEGEVGGVQDLLLPALHAADPARAEELYLGWIESLQYTPAWEKVAPILAASDLPATVAGCARLFRTVPPPVQPFLAACAAGGGDEDARAALLEALASDDATRRRRAAQAAALAGLVDELLVSLVHDPDVEVRRTAVSALAGAEPTDAIDARLSEALGDPDGDVRGMALQALVARGDAGAADQALAMLGGTLEELQRSLAALRTRMTDDPELASRARRVLIPRDEENAHRPIEERLAVLKAIGLVPGQESARYLRQVGLDHSGTISGKRVHELMMIHAANSGPEGLDHLAAELEHETDPARRLDLIWAASSQRTDGARRRLHEFLAEPDLSLYEVLFASDQLARLGPAQAVAPVLKRICYRIEDDEVRLAMRCLMWKWY